MTVIKGRLKTPDLINDIMIRTLSDMTPKFPPYYIEKKIILKRNLLKRVFHLYHLKQKRC